MGVGYQLINIDKREIISFSKVDTGFKPVELSGTAISSSMITYYLLKNIGDRITFVDDYNSAFNLFGETLTWDDLHSYKDVTESLIANLIQNGLYQDVGITWVDKEEGLFFRDLRNVFDPKCGTNTGLT